MLQRELSVILRTKTSETKPDHNEVGNGQAVKSVPEKIKVAGDRKGSKIWVKRQVSVGPF